MTRDEWERLPRKERVKHNARMSDLKCEPDGKPWRYTGHAWPNAEYIPWTPDDWRSE